MLQKILVVLIGLVMSVLSALSPSGGLFAAQNDSDPLGSATEQTLATIRTTTGEAFARIPVLWVEVDGERVDEDAWGTGEIDEMRFKVGVKGVDGTALSVGDKAVELGPTDIVTVRMFHGDYSYRGVGTPLATIQLQGEVKATELSGGEVDNKLRTERDPLSVLPAGKAPAKKDAGPIAYVVLDTGKHVDTVALASGGARLFTEEAAVAAEAKNAPGALAAKWVKVDGRAVRDHLSGDGVVDRIEFEPLSGKRGVVLAYNDAATEALPGERVVVTDFVGAYTITQTPTGEMRVRLDGYAGTMTTSSTLPLPTTSGGVGAPLAAFDLSPGVARTIDTVQFTDKSRDDDGVILLWQWDFGDNATSVLPNPSHTFTRPGVYDVTLNVTDNDMKSSVVTRKVTVVNTEPVPDFTFAPTRVSADTLVTFADRATDPDGVITSWRWDFGDGSFDTNRSPTHQYATSGNKTVTLTVADDRGASASLSKVLTVLNTPPTARFTFNFSEEGTDPLDPVLAFEGGSPATLVPIYFHDDSSDRDGTVVSWAWTFGDGSRATGSEVSHAFARPGAFTVSLTVTDNSGETQTVSKQIVVRNRAPIADFVWLPVDAPVGVPVTFTSTSRDVDGGILSARWSFDDGTAESIGTSATHTFTSAGVFDVALTVTDITLATSTVRKSVAIANSAPRADFIVLPNPAFRNTTVTFTDTSTDVDRDNIVSRRWDFGNGDVATAATVQRSFDTLGTRSVTLYVTDSTGKEGWITRTVSIANRPPVGTMAIEPQVPIANRPIYFNASGADTDSQQPVHFEWTFNGDPTVYTDQNLVRVLPEGTYDVFLKTIDADGTRSPSITRRITVDFAVPVASFSFVPHTTIDDVGVVIEDREIQFNDASSSGNGAIAVWDWQFSDQTSSSQRNPKKTFTSGGDFTVELTVTDEQAQPSEPTRIPIWVDRVPDARFNAPAGSVGPFTDVAFADDSFEHDAGDMIKSWHWDFGDGETSTDRNPVHQFTRPGVNTVTLTVTDRFGGANVTSKDIEVINQRPVAAWHTEGALVANEPIGFVSYPDSFDPDDPVWRARGASLTGFAWSFGDRGSTATTPNATHTFPRSGTYRVSLAVTDGQLTSVATPQSDRFVKIAANHDVPVTVTATLPGGRVAQLDEPRYFLEMLVGTGTDQNTYREFGTLGGSAVFTIPRGSWASGEPVVVRLRDTSFNGPQQLAFLTLSEESGISQVMAVQFAIPVPLEATIGVEGGEEPGMLEDLFPRRANVGGEALYASFSEHMNGTGRVAYVDGFTFPGIDVEVQARWVPARIASPVRNALQPGLEATGTDQVIGWCEVDSVLTAADGTFAWAMDETTPCMLNGSFHPLGRWEFRAIARYGAGEAISAPAGAYVDPTGGLLFGATFALV